MCECVEWEQQFLGHPTTVPSTKMLSLQSNDSYFFPVQIKYFDERKTEVSVETVTLVKARKHVRPTHEHTHDPVS